MILLLPVTVQSKDNRLLVTALNSPDKENELYRSSQFTLG